MATLTGQRIKDSYKDLLQVSNSNSGIDSTLRVISDGEATDSVLQLSTTAVNISSAGALQYAGVAITSTAAELNILDGATVTVAELNVLDGYTGSVTELNYLDTLHATGVTNTEFDYLDGVTSNIQTQLDATLDTAGALIDLSSTTINVDLTEAGEAAIANGDYILFLDGGATGTHAKEAIADVATLFAGAGMTATSSVINVIAGTGIDVAADAISVDVSDFMSNGASGRVLQATGADTMAASTNVNIDGNHLELIDSGVMKLGNSGDLQLFHNGTNSFIENYTGTLFLDNKTSDQDIYFKVNDGGSTITALQIDASDVGSVKLPNDNQILYIGAGLDLRLRHDGSNSYIQNITGALLIDNLSHGSKLQFATEDSSGTKEYVLNITGDNHRVGIGTTIPGAKLDVVGGDIHIDATQKIYFDGGSDTYIYEDSADSLKIFVGGQNVMRFYETSNVGYAYVPDSGFVGAGNSIDLTLSHDGSNSQLTNNTGDLYIRNNTDDGDIYFQVDDSSTQITAIQIDASETAAVKLPNDNQILMIGAGGDLKFVHDATNSSIQNHTGNLYINNYADDTDIILQSDDGSGGVTPYITLDGSTVKTDFKKPISVEDSAFFADNSVLYIGTGNDLRFSHNGSDSYIQQTGTGDLYIQQTIDDKDIILLSDDGSGGSTAYLTLDGSSTRIKIDQNMEFQDDVALKFGTSDDMRIYHDGSNSYIRQEGTGNLLIRNDIADQDILLQTDDGSGGTATYMTLDGSASLTKFHIDTKHTDSVKGIFGDSSDLQIYHDGSNSYIDQAGTGDLYIRNTTDDKAIFIQTDDGSGGVTDYMKFSGNENLIRTYKNFRLQDSVQLQVGSSADLRILHDGTNSEIKNYTAAFYITQHLDDGDIILRCDDGSGGVTAYLTLDGSATKTTLQKDLRADDDVKIQVGSSGDFYMVHDSGTGQGQLINGTDHLVIVNNANDHDIIFKSDDGAGGTFNYFYLDGSLATHDGSATTKAVTTFPDKSYLTFGTASDLQIFHDGSNSKITQNSVGNLYIEQTVDDGDIILSSDDGSGGTDAYLTIDGSTNTIFIAKDTKLDATKKLFLDGGSHTYIQESADDILDFYAGGDLMLRLDETNNVVSIPQDAAKATFKIGESGDWEQYVSGIDVICRNKTAGGNIRWLTDDNVENMRFIDTEVTFNDGSADMDFRIESNGDANCLFVDGGANTVNIGASASRATIAGYTPKFNIEGAGAAGYVQIVDTENGQFHGGSLVLHKHKSGGIANDTELGSIWFGGTDSANAVFSDGALIRAMATGDDNADGDNVAASLLFFTNGGSTGTSQLVEHLRIASDGTLTGTDTSIGSNSDLRLKENVKDFNSGLDIISKLQPKTFNFKNQTEHLSGTRRGFIAQEVKAVDDYWIDEVEIKESNPDYKYVEDTKGQSFVSKLTDKDAMYVSAIQELKQEIDKLKLKLGEKNG